MQKLIIFRREIIYFLLHILINFAWSLCYSDSKRGDEMIEIVYEKEKQKPVGNEAIFKIPNNIRQIGEVNETQKIYIEDYAYTYLSRLSNENMNQGRAAILLGQTNWQDGTSYLFVRSAIALSDMEVSEEHLVFSEEIWNQVYEKSKEYFKNQDIVGWYLSIPGCSMELHEIICKTHINHFGGNDKVLLVMEPTEKEEAFYRYEGGKLSRQEGYYIYYEKNDPMQDYLIAINENKSIEKDKVEDKAVKNFRKIIETKNEERQAKKTNSLIYAAATCMLAAIVIVGVVFINDYNKLQKMESAITEAAGGDTKEAAAKGQGTKKEAKPQDNTDNQGNNTQGTNKEEGQKPQGQPENQTPVNDQAAADNTVDSQNQEQSQPQETQQANQQQGEQPQQGQEQPQDAQEQQPPAEQPEQTQDPSNAEANAPVSSAQSYIVQDGDTLTSISKKYYGSISKIKDICAYNNLAENQIIFPGQKILLP